MQERIKKDTLKPNLLLEKVAFVLTIMRFNVLS